MLSMLLVQVFATGMQILTRVILVEGTFIFALIAYRHIVAAVCVAPFAFYFERQLIELFFHVSACLNFLPLLHLTVFFGLNHMCCDLQRPPKEVEVVDLLLALP